MNKPYAVLELPNRRLITRDIADFVRLGVTMPDGAAVEMHANKHGAYLLLERDPNGTTHELYAGTIPGSVAALAHIPHGAGN